MASSETDGKHGASNGDIFDIKSRFGELDASVSKEYDSLFSMKKKKVYIRRGSFPVTHHIHAIVAMHLLGVCANNLIPWMKEYKNSSLVNTPEFYQQNHKNIDVFGNYEVTWNEIINSNSNSKESKYLGTQTNFYGIRDMFENDLSKYYNNNIYSMLSDRYEFLSFGLIGIAIHSPIQIGYSIAVNHSEGIIDGLTQSVYSYHSLPYKPSIMENENLFTIINESNSKNAFTLIDCLNYIHKNEYDYFLNLRKKYQNEKGLTQFAPDPNRGFPQSIGIFRKYGFEKISNYIKSISNLKNENILPTFKITNNNNNGNDSLKAIKKWLMRNVIYMYLYCQETNKNDFFLLHLVTSSWSLCEILQKIVENRVETSQSQSQAESDSKQKETINENDQKSIESTVNTILFNYFIAMMYCYVACKCPQIDLSNKDKIVKSLKIDEKILANKQEMRKLIVEKVNDRIIPNYELGKNLLSKNNEKYDVDHDCKVIQCVLDALQLNIIDETDVLITAYTICNPFTRP